LTIDRWWGTDPTTGKKSVKKANFGKGVRWQVAHYAEQPNGTRKLVSKNFERAADAEEYRTRTAHELREGSYRPREVTKKTYADAAAAWFSSKKKPTGSSLLRYRNALDIWVLPAWEQRTLSTIQTRATRYDPDPRAPRIGTFAMWQKRRTINSLTT
jgi:hypothetical protein